MARILLYLKDILQVIAPIALETWLLHRESENNKFISKSDYSVERDEVPDIITLATIALVGAFGNSFTKIVRKGVSVTSRVQKLAETAGPLVLADHSLEETIAYIKSDAYSQSDINNLHMKPEYLKRLGISGDTVSAVVDVNESEYVIDYKDASAVVKMFSYINDFMDADYNYYEYAKKALPKSQQSLVTATGRLEDKNIFDLRQPSSINIVYRIFKALAMNEHITLKYDDDTLDALVAVENIKAGIIAYSEIHSDWSDKELSEDRTVAYLAKKLGYYIPVSKYERIYDFVAGGRVHTIESIKMDVERIRTNANDEFYDNYILAAEVN